MFDCSTFRPAVPVESVPLFTKQLKTLDLRKYRPLRAKKTWFYIGNSTDIGTGSLKPQTLFNLCRLLRIDEDVLVKPFIRRLETRKRFIGVQVRDGYLIHPETIYDVLRGMVLELEVMRDGSSYSG